MSALLCAVLCLVLALAGVAQADIAKPNDDFYYYDDAGVMTEATRAMIYYNNVELQKACGAQIVVAAVRTLGGMTCESYAYQLINDWGVGDKDENNGAVLLLAIEEDDYYLLSRLHPDDEFFLIIGGDNWANFNKWKNHEDIVRDYNVLIYPRIGFDKAIMNNYGGKVRFIDAPIIELSSTEIRAAIQRNQNMSFFLSEDVYQYILKNKLYTKNGNTI